MNHWAGKLLAALSLSTLCFLPAWFHVLAPPFQGYHLRDTPGWANYASPMIDVLLVAGLLVAAYALVRYWRGGRFLPIARWTFLLLTLLALNAIRLQAIGPLKASSLTPFVGRAGLVLIIVLGAGVALALLVRWPRQIISVAQILILVLSPFAAVTFYRAIRGTMETGFAGASTKKATRQHLVAGALKPKARVLWIIFDELDYRATFESHPASVHLPELDRLRGESLFATNAYPPAGSTTLSLPALITGKLVSAASPEGSNELMITFAGSASPVKWSEQPNIFFRTLELGGETGLVGWHHPYCRVLGADLTKCSWTLTSHESDRYRRGLGHSMLDDAWRSGLGVPVMRGLLPKFFAGEKDYLASYLEFLKQSMRDAEEMATDADLSLVLVHFPTPHPPCAYSRETDDFSRAGCNYFDNLVLVDRIFGELRRGLEQQEMWNGTAVLVSADHWWRLNYWQQERFWTKEEAEVTGGRIDYRIPFMLKLPDQKAGVRYERGFNTIVTHDLLLALMRDELSGSAAVISWLDAHRAIEKTPY